MKGETYRINSPTLAILSRPDGKRLPKTVPVGAIVTVVAGPLDGTRLVEVEWDDDILLMFTVDLREAGTLVDHMSAVG